MWRREDWLLRVGRAQVELWQGVPGALVLVARQDLGEPLRELHAGMLSEALTALWPQASGLPARGPVVTVIVESAWMPVVLLATGPRLWRSVEVMALAQHRFVEVHGPQAASWSVRVDHRPGEAHGLAFGIAPDVLAALQAASEARELVLAAVQPALVWGFNATRTLADTHEAGWWLWPEQDRHLLARVDRGSIQGLHPALPATLALTGRGGIAEAVEVERQRLGEQDEGLGLVAATWTANRARDTAQPFIQWVALAGGIQ